MPQRASAHNNGKARENEKKEGMGGTRETDAQEVSELAEEGARGDDSKALSEPPDEADEDADDLVAEELPAPKRASVQMYQRLGGDAPAGRR